MGKGANVFYEPTKTGDQISLDLLSEHSGVICWSCFLKCWMWIFHCCHPINQFCSFFFVWISSVKDLQELNFIPLRSVTNERNPRPNYTGWDKTATWSEQWDKIQKDPFLFFWLLVTQITPRILSPFPPGSSGSATNEPSFRRQRTNHIVSKQIEYQAPFVLLWYTYSLIYMGLNLL